MGDFKTAFVEGLGKSLAYAAGGIIFLILLGILGGTGLLAGYKAGLLKPKPPIGGLIQRTKTSAYFPGGMYVMGFTSSSELPYTTAASFPNGPRTKVGGHDGTPMTPVREPPMYTALPRTRKLNYLHIDNSDVLRSYHDGHPTGNSTGTEDPAQIHPGMPRCHLDAAGGTTESQTKVRAGPRTSARLTQGEWEVRRGQNPAKSGFRSVCG